MSSDAIGGVMGTDTICAHDLVQLQPNPFARPYSSIIVFGAASTVLWQVRQASLLIWIGRASTWRGRSDLALADDFHALGSRRSWFTISDSHS